jgi:hypothetical protein
MKRNKAKTKIFFNNVTLTGIFIFVLDIELL